MLEYVPGAVVNFQISCLVRLLRTNTLSQARLAMKQKQALGSRPEKYPPEKKAILTNKFKTAKIRKISPTSHKIKRLKQRTLLAVTEFRVV